MMTGPPRSIAIEPAYAEVLGGSAGSEIGRERGERRRVEEGAEGEQARGEGERDEAPEAAQARPRGTPACRSAVTRTAPGSVSARGRDIGSRALLREEGVQVPRSSRPGTFRVTSS